MTDVGRIGSPSPPVHTSDVDQAHLGSLRLGSEHVSVRPIDRHVEAPVPQQEAGSDDQIQPRDDAPSLGGRTVPRARAWGALTAGIATSVAVGGTGIGLIAAGKGALIGAALGSIVPGAGTLVGAVVGAAIGGLGSVLLGGGIGHWLAGGSGRDKAERGIAHLLAKGKITPKEAAGLKALDKDELKELVSLSKRRTGITEKADRYAIRAAVLLTAAKRGPAAARELRADLIHLANTEGPRTLRIAIANYMKAGEYLEPDGDPRFDDIRGNPVREAAYRSVFLGLVRNGWTFERSPEWMLQRSCDALDHIRDRSDEQLSEPHHYYNPFRGGRVVDDTAMEKSRWKYGSKANFNLIDAKAPGFLQRRKPLSGVGPDDVLVIDGHGADRLDVIGIQEGSRKTARLTAEQLAQQLEQEGLRKDHRVIRLIACYAGGSPLAPEQDRGYRPVLERNRTVTDRGAPFAMRLAMALKARGYDNIVVGGYPGTVHNVDLGGKTITTHGQGSAFTIKASGLCNYFDGNGNPVKNPRNEEKAILTDEDKDRIIMERNNLYGHY